MKKHMYFHLLGALVCLLLPTLTSPQRIYVKAGATGDGSSWECATGDLAGVLATTKPGTEIWVAHGTYTPGDSRHNSFLLRNGIAVYGGFSGHETTLAERDVYHNVTVLSGEIGSAALEDNTYNVVYVTGWSDATRLDGFVIRAGYADGTGTSDSRTRCGSALYLEAPAKEVMEVQIVNCVIEANYSKDGGAVYIAASHGRRANPVFVSCLFRGNRAELDGGALYLDARLGGQAEPQIWHCTFEQNHSNYGGALFANGLNGHVSATIRHCRFVHNSADVRGGAVYLMDAGGHVRISLESCRFLMTRDGYENDHVVTYSSQRKKAEQLASRL